MHIYRVQFTAAAAAVAGRLICYVLALSTSRCLHLLGLLPNCESRCVAMPHACQALHGYPVLCCVMQAPSDVTGRFVAQLMAACQDTDYQVCCCPDWHAAGVAAPRLFSSILHSRRSDKQLVEHGELLQLVPSMWCSCWLAMAEAEG